MWTGAENLAATGFRSPDRPARSESLYRLRYPGRRYRDIEVIICDLPSCSSFYLQHMAAVNTTDKNLDNFCSFCLFLSAGFELKVNIASLKTVTSVKRLFGYMIRLNGARGCVVVKALPYKPAGRGFDSRWCHWKFSVT